MSPSILKKKPKINCLISAGPTREWIDPVRFLSNPSSGKMGYALAKAAKDLQMNVVLVSGPVNLKCPRGVKFINVETAQEMQNAMDAEYEFAHLIIMCAAVSDHRPSATYDKKIHKDDFPMRINLVKNPDILKSLGLKKKNNQVLVGFAAETNDIIASASKKLNEKNLDWIVVNDVSSDEIGFSSDKNEVILLSANGIEKQITINEKIHIAKEIIKSIYPSCLEKAL